MAIVVDITHLLGPSSFTTGDRNTTSPRRSGTHLHLPLLPTGPYTRAPSTRLLVASLPASPATLDATDEDVSLNSTPLTAPLIHSRTAPLPMPTRLLVRCCTCPGTSTPRIAASRCPSPSGSPPTLHTPPHCSDLSSMSECRE